MTLFEYLAIAFSLVLSSAAMRLVGGLPAASRPPGRYWVHLVAVGIATLGVAIMFWAFWSYRNAEWSLPRFLGLLAQAGVVYFGASTLVPENPNEVTSWRDHYYAVRVRYYVAQLLMALLITVNATVLIDMPLLHPARLAPSSILTVSLVALASASPRVHGGLMLAGAALSVLLVGTVMFSPDALIR